MMREKTGDIIGGVASIIFGIYIFFKSMTFPNEAAVFPQIIASLFIFAGSILTIQAIKNKNRGNRIFENIALKHIAVVFSIWVLTIFSLNVLGFLISICLYMMIICWLLRGRPMKAKELTSIFLFGGISTLSYWVIFCRLVELEFPEGIFF